MAGRPAETARVRRFYERAAPMYDRQMRFFDWLLFSGGREWVCSQAEGEVLEIAIGSGRNLRHYPEEVKLTGIELSPAMLETARRTARDLGRDVDLYVGDAQALELPDASFDTVVCTLALCTIPDDRAAIAEIMRVLRPGGRLLLLEHVRSSVRPIRLGERLLERLTVRLAGDHLLREPLDHLRAEGFVVQQVLRSKLQTVERVTAMKPRSTASCVRTATGLSIPMGVPGLEPGTPRV